jgi:branched-chain amino acid transport system permease protein
MSLVATNEIYTFKARHGWGLAALLAVAVLLWMFLGLWPTWLEWLLDSKKTFINAVLNGVTLAGLYFLVASGFTLVFGLMRNVNLAHGSLYLLGAYIGYDAALWTGNWFLGVLAGTGALAVVGMLLQIFVFQRLENDELRQTLATIGISIVAADLMLAIWGGKTYQFMIPDWLDGAVATPIITAVKANGQAVFMKYPLYRLVVLAVAIAIGVGLWLMLNRTPIGVMIRAGVDDRAMLSVAGINVHLLFVAVFAIGAGLAGFAGVVGGSALSIAPGEDVRYLLASLVVVIVGGMGSITGAAVGALLIGLAEQMGLVYFPTYGVVLTFLIMVLALAIRPQGIMANARTRFAEATPPPAVRDFVVARVGAASVALAAALVLYPLIASPFFIFQIGAQVLILGMIGLSLMVLTGYGGMVSLAQLTVAGVAAYAVAICGQNSVGVLGLGWPWFINIPFAILLAAMAAALIGFIAERTAGIYTIMITLALAMAFFLFAQQNYAVFNGFAGFRGVQPPIVLGVYWRDPVPFYYLSLALATLAYLAVVYCARSPYGRGLTAARDNIRRMRALGYDVRLHKVVAYFLAGIIAGTGGVLYGWFNGRISPGTISVGETISILVIAMIGGIRHPIGPFLGAAVYVLLKTFAIDLVGAERFNTLIGLVFLAIVFVSPDGIVGLWHRIAPRLAPESLRRA